MTKSITFLILVIFLLSGCAEFVQQARDVSLAPGWDVAARELSSGQLGEFDTVNEARIIFTRESNLLGCAVPHCVMDTGSAVDKNVYVFQKRLMADQLDDFDVPANLFTVAYDQYAFIQYRFIAQGWQWRPIGEINNKVVVPRNEELRTMTLQELFYRAVTRCLDSEEFTSETIPRATAAMVKEFNAKESEAEYFMTERDVFSWGIGNGSAYLTEPDWDSDDIRFTLKLFTKDHNELLSITILSSRDDIIRAFAKSEGVSLRMADIIGDVDSGETISWDRPPGTMRLEVFTPGGDQGFMRPIEVKAGFVYRITYDYGLGGVVFTTSEETAMNR